MERISYYLGGGIGGGPTGPYHGIIETRQVRRYLTDSDDEDVSLETDPFKKEKAEEMEFDLDGIKRYIRSIDVSLL